jgi:F-type H+-transporting ATPase subunit b
MSRSIFCLLVIALSCGKVLAEGAAEAEQGGGNLFSGTFGDALWTVVAFLVLVAILGKYAWKPLLKALDARQNHIEGQIKSAQESRHQAEHLLSESKQQGASVVRQATEQAQRQLQEAADKSRQEADAIRRRAQEEIASAEAAAREELWRQAGDIALHVGGQVLSRTLTDQDNQRLVDEAVAKVRQSGAAT